MTDSANWAECWQRSLQDGSWVSAGPVQSLAWKLSLTVSEVRRRLDDGTLAGLLPPAGETVGTVDGAAALEQTWARR